MSSVNYLAYSSLIIILSPEFILCPPLLSFTIYRLLFEQKIKGISVKIFRTHFVIVSSFLTFCLTNFR